MKVLFAVLAMSVAGTSAGALGAEVESPSGSFQPQFSAFIGCSPMTIECGREDRCGATACCRTGDGGLRTISVSGTAVTRTKPDTVVWHITTSDFDKDLMSAKESSDKKLKAIIGLREELGIGPEDLETGQLSIQREYETDERGHRTEFKHFAVSRGVTIRQRDLNRFDEFFSRLVSSAEMEVSVSFESSRIYELRAETRLKALRIAQDKAGAMAKELGADVGKVLTIDEQGPSGRSFSSPFSNAMFVEPVSRPEVDTTSGTFAPGDIEVRVTVYASFEIE